MIKGNKGEWSEFYAFLKILVDRKLFAADENLDILADKFYLVLKVIREEAKNGKKTYDISTNDGKIKILDTKGEQIAIIDESTIKPKISNIFAQMKAAPDTTFSISLAEEAMRDLHCTQIKAMSNKKADIVAVIHDRISPTFPELGFSIKSMLGAASTLLNASGATNFIFKINNLSVSAAKVNAIEGHSKVRDRIKAIEDSGAEIVFEGLENENFRKNLRKIDTVLPEILAEVIKAFYEGKGGTLPELVDMLEQNKVLETKFGLSKSDYEYKLKSFLAGVALGMTPKTEWDGFTKAHGGYIVVKENGEIVCYHLYNRDEFQEYLYRNTRLETPSTTRHQFAKVYKEKGNSFIKLNLQIRFVR